MRFEQSPGTGIGTGLSYRYLSGVLKTQLILPIRHDIGQLLDKLEQSGEFGFRDWELVRQTLGFAYGSRRAFTYRSPKTPTPQYIVNQAAMLMIKRATNQRAEDWLSVGFAGYCENVVFKTNIVTWHEYQLEDFRIGPNWRMALRQLVANRRIRQWTEMFELKLRDYFAAEQITAFGMTTFLVESNPKAFLDFIKQVALGTKTADALALAYGKDVNALDQDWLKWIARQR